MTEVSIRSYRELISNRFLPQLVLTAETVQWSVTETQRSEHRAASNSRPVLHLAGPYLITRNKRGGWVGHHILKSKEKNRTNFTLIVPGPPEVQEMFMGNYFLASNHN